MRVSVVVPVKDDPRVAGCVAAILALEEEAGDLEVIVVNNGSEPGFAAVLDALPPAVRVLHTTDTVYAARNAGIAATSGEAVFLTDADCIVQPGWLAEGIAGLAGGAGIVQGFSGSLGSERSDRLVQARYGAHLTGLRAGDPTECDTRNTAVRREVLDRLRFNPAYRRVGDTEFGLRAEAAGFRVAYRPQMRVLHAHEPDLRLVVAKQICHGWGAQRLMRERPGLPWHGGHLRLIARVNGRVRRWPLARPAAWLGTRLALAGAGAVQRAGWLPDAIAVRGLGLAEKAGAAAGHLLYEAGREEPSPSGLLGRQVARD